ncbi:MAG: hypothetical protein E7054_08050 [Lentisphaerae bacterium]|nr:hypothetical protein [Lentisphaerota bacterium]
MSPENVVRGDEVMKNMLMFFTVVFAVMFSGCIFSGTPVKFELYTADLPGGTLPYRVGAVSNLSGAGREFLVQDSGSQVSVDRSRRFLNEPDQMLRSALSVVCTGEKGMVSAQVIKFEFSPGLKSLNGVAVFSIKVNSVTKTIVCRETVKVEDNDCGRAAAEFFERCIKQISGVKL